MRIGIAALIAVTLATTVTAQKQHFGNATFSHDVDIMTDKDRPDVQVKSAEGDKQLMWWCDSDNDLGFSFYWGKFFAGRDDRARVMYRFSAATPAATSTWRLVAHRGAILFDQREIKSLTENARRNPILMMRAIDLADGESVDAIFSLDGVDEALKLLPCVAK